MKICENCGKEFEPPKIGRPKRFCCYKCKDRKYQQENKEKIKKKHKKYLQENKEKISQQSKIYYQENKEKIKEWTKKYSQENKKQRKEYNKKYRQEHKEKIKKQRQENKEYYKKWRQENKEKIKEKQRKYIKEHPEQHKLLAHKRKVRIKANGGSYTIKQIRKLRKIALGVCKGYKRKPHFVGDKKLEIDHIIPVSKWKGWALKHPEIKYECGDIKNIQLLCGSCNRSKGNILNS